jgi:hypothetical protein
MDVMTSIEVRHAKEVLFRRYGRRQLVDRTQYHTNKRELAALLKRRYGPVRIEWVEVSG